MPDRPALIVMAAGIGSRYGGLKQVEPVGPGGEIVIDYSVYDAIRSGFGRVIFVIRRDMEREFRAIVERHISGRVPVAYVFQELDALPAGFAPPAGRVKPWGTGHAVLLCAGEVEGPFAVINADDFYGRRSFETLCGWLRRAAADSPEYALVGYVLRNTLSDHGSVARGLCEVDPAGRLVRLVERFRIEKTPGGIRMEEDGARIPLSGGEPVSMNMWGFTPTLFGRLEEGFRRFLRDAADRPKSEYLIPTVVGEMVRDGTATVEVLPSPETWLGVTYPEDKPSVVAGIRERIEAGEYPVRLWG